MSGPADDDDADDEESAVVERPRTLLERFRYGDKRGALAGMGAFVGASLAIAWLSGWKKIAYSTAPHRIQVLFWIAIAAFVFALIFQPEKFRSWRNPLGFVWMDGWRDYGFLAAAAGLSFAACAVIGRLI